MRSGKIAKGEVFTLRNDFEVLLLADSGEFELLGVVFVGAGVEVNAAAGFVEACCSDDDEFLGLAETLGVDGGLSADHADGRELGDLVGESHKVGNGAEGLVGEGGVEAGENDALAEMDEFERERDDVAIEELHLVDANDVDVVDLFSTEEVFAKTIACRSDDGGVVCVRAMAGDGGAVIAEVDVGLVAGDALAGDACALEAADEFFRFAGEHWASNDLDTAWSEVPGELCSLGC
jgi:hypothetical protein